MPRQQIVSVTLQQIDGEEIGAARMPGATVVGHGASIAGFDIWCNALRLLHPTGLLLEVALRAEYFWAGHAPARHLLSFACPKEM